MKSGLLVLLLTVAPAYVAAKHQVRMRAPQEIVTLVSQREDMKPWEGRSPSELLAWLNRGVRFDCDDDALVSKFYYTKLVLLANMLKEGIYDRPYVIEGGVYRAFWFESVPVTMQVFSRIDMETAKAQMQQFIKHQMADGYVPYKIMSKGPGERSIGYGWIAFAAWHLYLLDGDKVWLESFYAPLGRWIEWMGKFRDANQNGLYEAWSPGDMGHDFSARFQGLPLHVDNLRIPPKGTPTPYDAPDVNALMHLEMLSLGEIADVLGKLSEAQEWRRRATVLRERVNQVLWDEETTSYYDRDSKGQFVKMIGEVLLRPINGGLPTEQMARRIFEKHILNPSAFWTACPLPSFSLSDPLTTPAKPNTWSGPTMGLTVLRAPYGFQVYGRDRELREVLRRFLTAVVRQKATFQQYHPVTGEGGAPEEVQLYSPTAAVVLDGVARLYGIVPRGEHLEWRADSPAGSRRSSFEMDLGGKTYRLECDGGRCNGYLGSQRLFRVNAPSTVHTDRAGKRVPADIVRDFPRRSS